MAEAAKVTLGDLVVLTFLGWPDGHPKEGQPLVMTWNNRSVMLNPGDKKSIPFELAKKDFGDPRSVNDVIRIKDDYGNDMVVADRRAEVIRLQGLWQSRVPKFREYVPGDRTYLNDGISDMMPEIEIHDMDGNRVWMVVDDPYGDHVMAATPTIHAQEQLKHKIYEQNDTITELKRMNQILLDKLGIDPAMLLDPKPVQKADGLPDAPTVATLEEAPPMVYNPRTRRVVHKKTTPASDPTRIEDLEPDTD